MEKLKIGNIKWNPYDIFLAAVLSVCTVIMTRIQFTGGVWGTIEENYFNKFGVSAVVLFFFCLPVFYAMILLADTVLHKMIKKISAKEEGAEDTSKTMRFWGMLIVIAWLPYYLSYYPGGLFADTFFSISWGMSGALTNRFPFLYNTILGLTVRFGEYFGKDMTWSIGLFLAVQMLLLEAEVIYMLYWMIAHYINRRVRTCIMLFMVFFPLIPLYGISVWKDTPFCMACLLWIMFLVDLYLGIQKNQWNPKILAGFVAGTFLAAFTRNNGIYVAAFVVLVFIATTYRIEFEKKKLTWGIALLSVMMIFFIQGPVYRWIGVSPSPEVESLGVPLQQIGSVVVYDGNITDEQKECINRFVPYDNIKEHFSPCLVDNLKEKAGLNREYLSGHMEEFFHLWLHLLIQNPKIYIKEYLMETLGFWNPDIATQAGYVQNYVWNNPYGIAQIDYFEKYFGFSFQHFVNPRHWLSCACFFWAFFICAVFVIRHYGWRKAFLFAPQMGIWLPLMIATPIASSLRYIAALMFALPFIVIIPMLLERESVHVPDGRGGSKV